MVGFLRASNFLLTLILNILKINYLCGCRCDLLLLWWLLLGWRGYNRRYFLSIPSWSCNLQILRIRWEQFLYILLTFMWDSNMLPQTVFVFECFLTFNREKSLIIVRKINERKFLTIFTFPWRLRCVLSSHVTPQIHRCNDQFTELTLSPFWGASITSCLCFLRI